VKLPATQIPKFQGALLAWFRQRKRNLPWRRTSDPYRIWLSEVMLQQTRASAVAPYYRRFLGRFPTLRALARARSDQVLRLWGGLGYYSRARNLHRAAKEIIARHAGRFPRNLESALALPGVGRYTAAAVLSIAYGAPLGVVDGNVARVLARLGALRGDLRAQRRWKQLQGAAQELLAARAPGRWNQAMMELGATVCTPREPRCAECPASRWCRAYWLGITKEVPSVRGKRPPVKITLAAAVLLDPQGHTLVVKHEEAGGAGALFSRMWQFPAVQVSRDAQEELARHLRVSLGLNEVGLAPLAAARHSVTFRQLTLLPFLVRLDCLPRIPGTSTPPLAKLERLPVSSATRKIAVAALRSA
jgi:A/G-specific adenine glycosylase